MAEGRVDVSPEEAEELARLDEEDLHHPEPQQVEEEEDNDLEPLREGGAPLWLVALVGVLVFAVAVTVSYLLMGLGIKEIREELSAKADTTQVYYLTSVVNDKAERSDLDRVDMRVDSLTGVVTAHNTRLAEAAAEIKKASGAASAASNAAKKANQVATESRNRLDQLVHDNAAWVGRVGSQLDTLRTGLADSRREIDSRVGPVAVDLSTFQAKQIAVNTVQDSVNAVHTTAVKAFRAKLRLSDKDMARLAAELEKRQQRKEEKKGKR